MERSKLDMFKDYAAVKLNEQIVKGVIDMDFLQALVMVDESEWNHQADDHETTGKRKRKMTAVMKASKSQELEYGNSSKKNKSEESTAQKEHKNSSAKKISVNQQVEILQLKVRLLS